MYDNFVSMIYEIDKLLEQPIHKAFKVTGIENILNSNGIKNDENLSDLYLRINKKIKNNGVVYTPIEIAEYMVSENISEIDIVNNPFIKILDPACGAGNLLIPVYRHLKKLFLENLELINVKNSINLKEDEIDTHIVKYNIYGYDIDSIPLKILRIDLFKESGQIIQKSLVQGDFLLNTFNDKFDIIIGNPPYVGHKSVGREYYNRLKYEYNNIFKDKSDISYCFFQKSINLLKKSGKLCFITSRYFMESQSGESLRTILKEYCSINKIVDFYGIRPFKGAGIDPIIIFIENDMNSIDKIHVLKPYNINKTGRKAFYESLFYGVGGEYKSFYINKNMLNNKRWILRDEEEREIIRKIEEKSFTSLLNICRSYQGIITGCDKAFIVNEEEVEKFNIEREILKPWIKSSQINKYSVSKYNNYIIYSDKINDINDYPNAIDFISKHRDRLEGRRECVRGVRKWYELQWGRKESIFDEYKIIFPYKSNSNRFTMDKGKCFSADVYALELIENVPFSYDYLLFLLNSKVYEYYFKSFAKKLGDNYFEYYPNNLLKLCVPLMDKIDFNNASEEDLFEFFDLTEEEIKIISCYS